MKPSMINYSHKGERINGVPSEKNSSPLAHELKNKLMKSIFGTLLLFSFISTNANVTLPSVFSDNMVLQQKTNAAIWGKADPGSVVKIFTSWNNKKFTAKVDDAGNWKVKVVTPSYGGPYNISVEQGNRIDLKNVLIGEVWLCSGQSNMEMPLAGWGKVLNYESEIANANYPQIRLLQAIHVASNLPLNDLKVRNGGWDICSPATVAEFSSTAYFFAKEIYNKTKIPIGLIHSSWGGTIAEAWTSYETLKNLPDFAEAAKKIRDAGSGASSNFEQNLSEWKAALENYDVGNKNNWQTISYNDADWKKINVPGNWEASALPEFDGVVWFRKKVTIPEDWITKEVKLSLGTIDDDDITWVNGVKVGGINSYNTDRVYTVPSSILKPGENIITVRIEDQVGNGGFYGDAAKIYIEENGRKISLAGDWLYKISFSMKDVPPRPQDPNSPNRPSVLYNAMLHPIIQYSIRGAIWYQGESNAGRAYQYRALFAAMIKDWRNKFSSGDFPFYFTQLANFMKKDDQPTPSAWAELREAQLITTSLKNTGMATTIDIGDAADIHPKNKQEVGRRLALIALNKIYGKQNEYSGPLYQSYKKEGNKIVLTFTHADGLRVSSGKISGFSIAGADKKFYWADAKIAGNKVVVSAKQVPHPVAVRYGWANNPDVNLFNKANLPALPFRTDDWPETTLHNK